MVVDTLMYRVVLEQTAKLSILNSLCKQLPEAPEMASFYNKDAHTEVVIDASTVGSTCAQKQGLKIPAFASQNVSNIKYRHSQMENVA